MNEVKYKFRVALGTAKYLRTCSAALPAWLRGLLWVALVCTLLPGVPDFGLDEAIYLVAGTVIWFRHRPLLQVCLRAAQLEVSHG